MISDSRRALDFGRMGVDSIESVDHIGSPCERFRSRRVHRIPYGWAEDRFHQFRRPVSDSIGTADFSLWADS
jgi:hypothetical protein